jgi:hypothetical protein
MMVQMPEKDESDENRCSQPEYCRIISNHLNLNDLKKTVGQARQTESK